MINHVGFCDDPSQLIAAWNHEDLRQKPERHRDARTWQRLVKYDLTTRGNGIRDNSSRHATCFRRGVGNMNFSMYRVHTYKTQNLQEVAVVVHIIQDFGGPALTTSSHRPSA